MEKIRYNEFLTRVALNTGMTKKQASLAVKVIFDEIKHQLLSGNAVGIPCFGTFEIKTRASHVGRDLRTKAPIHISETRSVGFRNAVGLKKDLNA